MRVAELAHGAFVHPRRVRVLAEHAAALIPPHSSILDVGTGDGQVAAALVERRADCRIEGIDVLVRPNLAMRVSAFDGRVIPKPSQSVDVVTCFDVLHHAADPAALLAEAARVARSCIVIKDHICDGAFARVLLGAMDDVGNTRHGVASPRHYWSTSEWGAAIDQLGLVRAVWQVGGLGLYPWPASLLFGGRLHVLARLGVPAPTLSARHA